MLGQIMQKFSSAFQTLPYTLLYFYSKEGWDEIRKIREEAAKKIQPLEKKDLLPGAIKILCAGAFAGTIEFAAKSIFHEFTMGLTGDKPSIVKEIFISLPVVATAGLVCSYVAPFLSEAKDHMQKISDNAPSPEKKKQAAKPDLPPGVTRGFSMRPRSLFAYPELMPERIDGLD